VDLLESISLLLVDEVHTLSDSRGACLEALITRMKYSSRLRIVAVSATLDKVSLQNLGQWLECPRPFSFDDSYRPVKIVTHVVGSSKFKGSVMCVLRIPHSCCVDRFYQSFHFLVQGNNYLFEKHLDDMVPSLIKQYGNRKPVMIFNSSRFLFLRLECPYRV
jgi:Lhr-like helicase